MYTCNYCKSINGERPPICAPTQNPGLSINFSFFFFYFFFALMWSLCSYSHSGFWHRSTTYFSHSLFVHPQTEWKLIFIIYILVPVLCTRCRKSGGMEEWVREKHSHFSNVCVCMCFFVRLSKRQSEFRNRGYLALKRYIFSLYLMEQ